MTIKAEWAQVIKDQKISIDCTYCEQKRCVWRINGRSAGLTRTMTTYSCDDCLLPALKDIRWA